MPPSIAELSALCGASPAHVREGLGRLASARMVVLQPASGELLMVPPFSAVPTTFLVQTRRYTSYANCAWDALGISTMLREPIDVAASCGCCGESMCLSVQHEQPLVGTGVIQFAVPARQWWDESRLRERQCCSSGTKSTSSVVPPVGMPRGAMLTLERAWHLAAAWFAANRRAPEWRRPPVAEVEALFASLGLTDPFGNCDEARTENQGSGLISILYTYCGRNLKLDPTPFPGAPHEPAVCCRHPLRCLRMQRATTGRAQRGGVSRRRARRSVARLRAEAIFWPTAETFRLERSPTA